LKTHVWRLRAGICDVDEGETVVGQAFAALPPDVRKVYDLPIAPYDSGGYAPKLGVAQE